MIERTDIPVEAHEKAYQLTTGELVAIGIARQLVASEEPVVALRISARLIDATGVTVTVGEDQAVIPPHVRTIYAGALADGTLTIDAEMVDAAAKAAERIRQYAAALTAIAKIPAVSS